MMIPHLPSEQVVETIAGRAGVSPTELSPLYEVIDPDALDALFTNGATRDGNHVTIEFAYQDIAVCVEGSGPDDFAVRVE